MNTALRLLQLQTNYNLVQELVLAFEAWSWHFDLVPAYLTMNQEPMRRTCQDPKEACQHLAQSALRISLRCCV